MRSRAAVAILATLLALVGVAPARAATPLVLSGQTSITAPRGGGQVVVRVPKTVDLPGYCDDTSWITVRGTAKFTAVVFSPKPYQAGVPDIVAGKLPDGRGFDSVCALGERPLPAGTYTLTVVHTPGTAVVKLRLPGLGGRLSIDRLRAVRAKAAVLPKAATAADVSERAGGWGRDGELAGQGMVATIAWLSGEIQAALYGSCDYPPGLQGSAPPELRYVPGCPTGQPTMTWAVRARSAFFTSSTSGIPAGTYGIGAWYTAPAGTVVRGGAVGVWVPHS